MTAFLAALGLRRRPAEHIGATDISAVLPARPERYVGKHHSGLTAEWTPAHTPGRHRAQHSRPEGERPDLRIEKTVPLDLARLREIAGGAPCGS